MKSNIHLEEKSFRQMTILIIGYILLQILANLTVGKSISFLGIVIPAGSLLYTISFTWMDVINHNLGLEKVKILIKIAAVVHILIAVWLKLYIWFPTGEWTPDSFQAQAIEFVFGNYVRITAASIFTGYISGNINAYVFSLMQTRTRFPIYINSIFSNGIASAVDGILFYVLAFAGMKSWGTVLLLAGTSALYKCIISVISVPLLYVARKCGFLNDRRCA